MYSKKVYLLHLLMLGGCNHVVHQHMHSGSQRSNSDCDSVVSRDETRKLAYLIFKFTSHNQTEYFKDELVEVLIQCGKRTNVASKDDPEEAVKLFRDLIKLTLPQTIIDEISHNLIGSLITHISIPKRMPFAKTCANAIAERIIQILETSPSDRSLRSSSNDALINCSCIIFCSNRSHH